MPRSAAMRKPAQEAEPGYFIAFYEDAAKAEAAAKAEGYTGKDGESWHDFVECHDYRTARRFTDLKEATAWLVAEIDAYKTVYGCGTIRRIEPVARRCRYCACNGSQATLEYLVDDSGITQDEPVDSRCCD